MKIYTKNLITDTNNLKQSCKKYEVDFLFITDEGFFRLYNDKYFKIEWPKKNMIVSKKDLSLLTFFEFRKKIKSLQSKEVRSDKIIGNVL